MRYAVFDGSKQLSRGYSSFAAAGEFLEIAVERYEDAHIRDWRGGKWVDIRPEMDELWKLL